MTDNKKGATPCESAPQNDTADSTRETSRETQRERGLYAPLLWAELGRAVKAKPFRGKGKRQARADAIRAKRHQGGAIAAELLGLILLGLVAGVLLIGGA
jgi:hypothetical protein